MEETNRYQIEKTEAMLAYEAKARHSKLETAEYVIAKHTAIENAVSVVKCDISEAIEAIQRAVAEADTTLAEQCAPMFNRLFKILA